jgi:hypothetical protein
MQKAIKEKMKSTLIVLGVFVLSFGTYQILAMQERRDFDSAMVNAMAAIAKYGITSQEFKDWIQASRDDMDGGRVYAPTTETEIREIAQQIKENRY